MMESALIDTTQSPIRVHLKWTVAAVPMLVPAVAAVAVGFNAVTADSIGGRMLAAVAAAALAGFVVNFYWSYRLELDRESLRRVRPFWLGTQTITLNEITGAHLRPAGFLHHSRIQFESPITQIRLMWRSQRYGSAWCVRDLRRLVHSLAERGIYVDASLDEYLRPNT